MLVSKIYCYSSLLDGVENFLLELFGDHLALLIAGNWNDCIKSESEHDRTFLNAIMWELRREYLEFRECSQTFPLKLGEFKLPRCEEAIEVRLRSARTEDSIDRRPVKVAFSEDFEDCLLHEVEDRRHLEGIHRTVNSGSQEVTCESILTRTAEESVEEMRMRRLHAVLLHLPHEGEDLLIGLAVERQR